MFDSEGNGVAGAVWRIDHLFTIARSVVKDQCMDVNEAFER
ncbi:MAG TPA: hypothetical protein VM532_17560 [Burkholderiales bacterium]|nr:hypothetical protein [Burkholderiales bacterium]